MNELTPERKKVVLLCCSVAVMGSGPVLLRGHRYLMFAWIAVMVVLLAFAIVQFGKLKRQEP